MSDSPAILLRYFNLFSCGLWLDAAEPRRPRVFQAQMRSQKVAACEGGSLLRREREDVLNVSSFHRLTHCSTPGEL